MNDYLQSGAEDGSSIRCHAAKIDAWLAKLLSQLHASQPARPKAEAQDITETWLWVERLVDKALTMVETEMQLDGCLGYQSAYSIHQALIAALVTGTYCPPPRIHVLLSMMHPKYTGKVPCCDADCLNGSGCLGNHLEVLQTAPLPAADATTAPATADGCWDHFKYNTSSIRVVIVHHKNDR